MNFSVSPGGTVAAGYVNAASTVIDSSVGCSHSNYKTKVTIRSPSGRSVTNQSNGLQVSASLPIAAEFGNYTITTTGTYSCSCIGPASFGKGQTVTVKKPTSLRTIGDENSPNTPPGCSTPVRYWKIRAYQVEDQNGQPINRSMKVDEAMSTSLNTCNVSLRKGGGTTYANGTFRDYLYMCGSVPACDNGGSCKIIRNQSWTADGNAVTPNFVITYTCSGVTPVP